MTLRRRSIVAIIGAVIACPFVYHLVMEKIAEWHRPFKSGDAIEVRLVEEARRSNGLVSLSILSDRVCVSPTGVGSTYFAEKFFPRSNIAFKETDESVGVWFIYIQDRGAVFIYGVRQRVLKWGSIYEDPETPFDQKDMCPNQVAIDIGSNPPSVLKFVEKSK